MSESTTSIYRILDVNANRATEGLRVIEEYVRFVLDDRHLTAVCKLLRHDLAAVLDKLPESHRLAARETQWDVGTTVATDAEYERSDARAVAVASMKRLEQSLRCLEEYGKVVQAALAPNFEQIRYRAYTLSRAISITDESCQRLEHARLYVLIDGANDIRQFTEKAQALVAAGVHLLQLRDKSLADRQLVERARILRQITANSSTLFIMNDRPDIAALANADGVHIGQEELTVKDARTIVGPEKLIGVSTHSIEQARQAVLDGANYIGCGPTFPSGTKKFSEFPGITFLKQVAAEIRLPSFAIGGIDITNLPQVLAAGIHRVAVSGAVTNASQPQGMAVQLLKELGN